MNVRVIPAIPKFTVVEDTVIKKKRVAAYARVSTDSEEQQTSYEAQIDYYTKYIKEKEEWSFVKVFTDEGISATNTKKRDGFNDMMQNKYKEACNALNILKETNAPIEEFDENLFFGLIENITIKTKELLIFNFKDGTEIAWNID